MADTPAQAANSTPTPTPAQAATPPATPASTAVTPESPVTIESLQAKLTAAEGKLADTVSEIRNLRDSNKTLKASADKWAEHETNQLSEVEKLKKQITDQEAASNAAKAEANKLRAQVVAQANGCDPEAAALWLGTQNLPEWTDDAIKGALAKAPAWVKAPAQPGVTTPAMNAPRTDGLLTQEQINKMTPEQIAANYDTVMKSLAALKA